MRNVCGFLGLRFRSLRRHHFRGGGGSRSFGPLGFGFGSLRRHDGGVRSRRTPRRAGLRCCRRGGVLLFLAAGSGPRGARADPHEVQVVVFAGAVAIEHRPRLQQPRGGTSRDTHKRAFEGGGGGEHVRERKKHGQTDIQRASHLQTETINVPKPISYRNRTTQTSPFRKRPWERRMDHPAACGVPREHTNDTSRP